MRKKLLFIVYIISFSCFSQTDKNYFTGKIIDSTEVIKNAHIINNGLPSQRVLNNAKPCPNHIRTFQKHAKTLPQRAPDDPRPTKNTTQKREPKTIPKPWNLF